MDPIKVIKQIIKKKPKKDYKEELQKLDRTIDKIKSIKLCSNLTNLQT